MDTRCCVTSGAPFEPDPQGERQLAAYFKALGHPHRVHILRFLLAQQACFAGELADALPIAASTVSQHLKQLREAGLIEGEVHGPRRCYRVAPGALADLKRLVEAL